MSGGASRPEPPLGTPRGHRPQGDETPDARPGGLAAPGVRDTRAVIVEAARAAYRGGGSPPSLEAIARKAGVSRATLYRYFPSRAALTDAVADQGMQFMAEDVMRGVLPLREILRMILTAQAAMVPLTRVMSRRPEPDRDRMVNKIISCLTPAIHRAQRDGQLRPDFVPADFGLMMRMLQAGVEGVAPPECDREQQAARLIEVLLDGLFAPGHASCRPD